MLSRESVGSGRRGGRGGGRSDGQRGGRGGGRSSNSGRKSSDRSNREEGVADTDKQDSYSSFSFGESPNDSSSSLRKKSSSSSSNNVTGGSIAAPPYVVGCHYDTDEQVLWFTIGSMRSALIRISPESVTELELSQSPGAFQVPVITCSGDIGRSTRSPPVALNVLLGETPPMMERNRVLDLYKNLALVSGHSNSITPPEGGPKNVQTESAKKKTKPTSETFMCTCENGVAFRNTTDVNDRWDQMRGAAEFQMIRPRGITTDDLGEKWLLVDLPYYGIKCVLLLFLLLCCFLSLFLK